MTLAGTAAKTPAETTPMIPVLTFKRVPLGAEIASLGAEEIGQVLAQVDHFAWRVVLHGERTAFRRAESRAGARRAIERAVNRWLTRLGVFYPGLEVQIFLDAGDEGAIAGEYPAARARILAQ